MGTPLTDNFRNTNTVFPLIWKGVLMSNNRLTFDEVNEALAYNDLTGELIWKISPGQRYKAGSLAGTWKSRAISTGEIKSYLYIVYKGRTFTAAQAIWLLKTGEWPSDTVQFVDGNTKNLRFNNLKLPMFPSKKTIHAGTKVRKMSKDAQRHYALKRYYGVSLAEYAEMYNRQNGRCAICHQRETTMDYRGTKKDLAVDHCHETGAVRELLCYACNSMLGQAKDNVEVLLAGAAYINKHSSNKNLGTPIAQTGQADAAQTTRSTLVQEV